MYRLFSTIGQEHSPQRISSYDGDYLRPLHRLVHPLASLRKLHSASKFSIQRGEDGHSSKFLGCQVKTPKYSWPPSQLTISPNQHQSAESSFRSRIASPPILILLLLNFPCLGIDCDYRLHVRPMVPVRFCWRISQRQDTNFPSRPRSLEMIPNRLNFLVQKVLLRR